MKLKKKIFYFFELLLIANLVIQKLAIKIFLKNFAARSLKLNLLIEDGELISW